MKEKEIERLKELKKEEEIEIMLQSGKQVFMYFSDKPIPPSKINGDGYEKIQAFRDKYNSLNSSTADSINAISSLTSPGQEIKSLYNVTF